MNSELQDLSHKLTGISRQAGEVILEHYHQAHACEIHTKADHSPVTSADIAAQAWIERQLQSLIPGLPILSEETAPAKFEQRREWERYWLVDPLDGTREFIRHSGEFTVNIALMERHRPLLGVIYVPVSQICYTAVVSEGAYKHQDGVVTPLHTKTWDGHQLKIAASRSFIPEKIQALMPEITSIEVIPAGSALKFAWVAEGRADLYFRQGDTCEWDTAAGQCILEQAGGFVVDLQGNSLSYNHKASLINPHFLAVGDKQLLKYCVKKLSGRIIK